MFNGIKSILFGYSTEDQNTETNSSVDSSTEQQQPTPIQVLKESSVFEQTLNAATTKLTEQLLPRCPSIEQLQSSSHQLLPTLSEQHEEDESKKRKLSEIVATSNDNDDEDEDGDGFNADSWELLDLVEKQPESSSVRLDDQKVQLQDSFGKTSGILKLNKSLTATSSNHQNIEPVVGTQKRLNKHKVSFETPDLVKETKEKIERITPKENIKSDDDQKQKSQADTKELAGKGFSEEKKEKTKKKSDKLQNKKKAGINTIENESVDLFCCELFPEIITDKTIEKLVESKEKVEVNQLEACKIVKPQPVLNYAAALSMKLNKSRNDESEKKEDSPDECSMKPKATSSSKIEGSLQASGAVKRNRPVSFSSSCYENDDDDCEIAWNDLGEPMAGSNDFDGKCKKWQDVDNDSIISSGFSDCDYGYEGLNDIVMRPKKTFGKKRRGLNNSYKASSMGRRDSVSKEVTKKTLGEPRSSIPERKNSTGSDKDTSKSVFSVFSSKNNIKSKKKKIVLSASISTNSYDFMKKQHVSASSSGFKLTSPSSELSRTIHSRSSATTTTTTCQPILASHLMPPPQPFVSTLTGSNTNSGNDSSDIADMDESWYVTPPPCFTGSNRFNKSKTQKFSKLKEADRENALIEHPSIYIASTSKQQQQQQEYTKGSVVETNEDSLVKPPSNDNLPLLKKQKPIVLRKVGRINNFSNSDSDNRKKTSSPTASTSSISPSPLASTKYQPKLHHLKKDVKAWENKFIVTNWGYDDEQEDVHEDFDNLFDESDNKCSSPTSVQAKKSSCKLKNKVPKKKREKAMKLTLSTRSGSPEISPVYESDEFSVPSPALMDEDSSSDMSLGEVIPTSNNLVLISNSTLGEENLKPPTPISDPNQLVDDDDSKRGRNEQGVANEKKAPIQVRPIEPERKPGWQLRRKRSKRRPLSSSMSNTCNSATGVSGGVKLTAIKSLSGKQQMMLTSSSSSSDASRSASWSGGNSNSSSSCSSPTLIDHMSSIVANLASGFTATNNPLPFQTRSTIDVDCSDKSNNAAITLAHSEQSNMDAVSRRRMSRSYLNRQNNCSKLGNMNRRADRRMKMRTTPNGYSINRKVHTNFH